jgi:hypothetical protein
LVKERDLDFKIPIIFNSNFQSPLLTFKGEHFMFERRHEPLLSRSYFALRVVGFFVAAMLLDCLVVALGAVGYRCFEGMSWVDAAIDSAMVITGNGPIVELKTSGGRIFAALDALAGAGMYVIVAGVLLMPIFHRLLHYFHMDIPQKEE